MAARYPEELKEQAREMRRAGMSVSRIAHELDVRSHSVVHRWVGDLPPPAWTRRPNAKDDVRQQARQLRLDGASLKDIAESLSVAKSTVSTWVRDLPVPPGLRERASHAHRINSARWRRESERREQARQEVKEVARASVGRVTDRELLLLGTVLYWAEGAKDKAYDRREFIVFINSDPRVIQLFQRWLDLLEVPEGDRRYRLSIHANADVEGAHTFWSGVTGVPVERFASATLKRHRPTTIRLNVGADYHGCLVISVCRSRVLYQRMEGLFTGIMAGVLTSVAKHEPSTD